MDLETGEDVFEIYLYDLSGEIGIDIDGSAIIELELLHLFIDGLVTISVAQISCSFTLSTEDKSGSLLLNVIDGSRSFAVDVDIDVVDLFNVTLQGSVDVDVTGGSSGYIEIAWNESGITGVDADFGSSVVRYINVTDLVFSYHDVSTSISLSVDTFQVEGSGSVVLVVDPGALFKFDFESNVDLLIEDLAFEWKNALGTGMNVTIMIDQVVGSGEFEFLFIVDDVRIVCNITVDGFDIYGVYVELGEYSGTVPSIESGTMLTLVLFVDVDVDVDVGDDYVNLVIGGEMHMEVYTSFTLNDINGGLSGIFDFTTPSDIVYINITTNNSQLETISIEGAAEFTIADLHFWLGPNVDIGVSRIVGSLDLNSNGKVGTLSILVDDSFTDVDIDIQLKSNNENITLEGNLNIDVTGASNGYLSLTWDLTGDRPEISFGGGELSGSKVIDVLITDLTFIMGNLTITANEISFNKTVTIWWDETSLYFESDSSIEAHNIHILIEGETEIEIMISSDFILEGYVLFEFEASGGHYKLCVYTPSLSMSGNRYFRFGEFEYSSSLSITISGYWCFHLYLL
jgi:hypothetical protein